ncbi:MAG: nucleotide-binding protein [Bacteroidales bacterium]|jgi:hypothetical protein|nr:nucleotide-binding protein [Bacteroidales bacterium]
MKIFIGSSTESKDVAEEIAEHIEDIGGHDTILWSDPDAFPPGKNIFDCLEKIAGGVDAAVFVFGEDDKVWYRDNEFEFSVRGNVLIEYGFFRGVLGSTNVLICTNGNPKMDSNLDGVVYIDFNKPRQAKVRIRKWLGKHPKLNYIDRILLPNGGDCLITIPSHNYNKDDVSQAFTRDQDVRLALDLRDLFKKRNVIFNEDNKINFGVEIHLGSPTISTHVNRYVHRAVSDFQWYIADNNFYNFYNEARFNKLPFPNIRKTSVDGWEGFKFNGLNFDYMHGKYDWAFLLRLGKDHFPEEPKTIHALFGIGESGRKGAVEYFIKNHPAISERWGSEDYLLAAKVDYHNCRPMEEGAFQKNLLSK